MQTFLPYQNFIKSAKCLDYKRLGKQRVEALQIHNIISGEPQEAGLIIPQSRCVQVIINC